MTIFAHLRAEKYVFKLLGLGGGFGVGGLGALGGKKIIPNTSFLKSSRMDCLVLQDTTGPTSKSFPSTLAANLVTSQHIFCSALQSSRYSISLPKGITLIASCLLLKYFSVNQISDIL